MEYILCSSQSWSRSKISSTHSCLLWVFKSTNINLSSTARLSEPCIVALIGYCFNKRCANYVQRRLQVTRARRRSRSNPQLKLSSSPRLRGQFMDVALLHHQSPETRSARNPAMIYSAHIVPRVICKDLIDVELETI
jgi:hypothetical protein